MGFLGKSGYLSAHGFEKFDGSWYTSLFMCLGLGAIAGRAGRGGGLEVGLV